MKIVGNGPYHGEKPLGIEKGKEKGGVSLSKNVANRNV